MPDMPSCFGHPGFLHDEDGSMASSSSSSTSSSSSPHSGRAQNVVSSLYHTIVAGHPALITVSWCRNLLGGVRLSVNISGPTKGKEKGKAASKEKGKGKGKGKEEGGGGGSHVSVSMKPWSPWKKNRKGSKRVHMEALTDSISGRMEEVEVEVVWDLSAARFQHVSGGPEPTDGYFVAVVSGRDSIALLLGDPPNRGQGDWEEDDEETKARFKSFSNMVAPGPAKLVCRTEHIVGRRGVYSARGARIAGESGCPHDIAIECGGLGTELRMHVDGHTVMHVKSLNWKFRGNHTIIVDGNPVEVFWDVHNWLFQSPHGHAIFMFHSNPSLLSSTKSINTNTTKRGAGFSLLLYAWKSE